MFTVFLGLVIVLGATEMLTKTLSNGMQVVVKKNTSNEAVAIYCFVKTGSLHEGKLLGSGLSHYVEHVVSSGTTTKRTEKEFMEIASRTGAVANAGTTYGSTSYNFLTNRENFSTGLQVIAEQMQFCVFDSTEVAREQQVIAKEIVRGFTSPFSKINLKYWETAYSQSNYRYPIIGLSDLFLRLQRQDLIDYYNRRYVPNNMVLVVAGNIDVDAALEEVEKAFSGFDRRPLEPILMPAQPVVLGTSEYLEEFEVLMPRVFINQTIPAPDLKDVYALNVVGDILINNDTAPMQKLFYEEQQLVNYFVSFTGVDMEINSGVLRIWLEAKDTSRVNDIVDTFYREMSKYQKGYFTQKQIDAAVHKFEAEILLKSRGASEECIYIGDSMVHYGVPDRDKIRMTYLKSLKPADLNRVVQKYYNPLNKFTFYALPQGQTAMLKSDSKASVAADAMTKTDLGKGLVLLHKQSTQYPIVNVTLSIPFSLYYGTEFDNGFTTFMLELLMKGSKKYSKDQITDWFEERSTQVNIREGSDAITFDFKCLVSDLDQMQKILIDAIQNPLFSDKDIDLLKTVYASYIKRISSDPGTIHNDYRKLSVYNSKRDQMSTSGKMALIQNITRKDVVDAFNKYIRAESMMVAIVGDLDQLQAAEVSSKFYNAFKRQGIDGTISLPQLAIKGKTYRQEYNFEAANIDIMMQGLTTTDPDYNTMLVIEALLNFGGKRLHEATRGKRDLVYASWFYNAANRRNGFCGISSQTSLEKMDKLQIVLEAELDRLINEPVSQKELTEAIAAQIKVIQNVINEDNAGTMAIAHERQGLGYDYPTVGIENLKKVTPADIQRVAKKYFSTRDVIISVPSSDVKRMVEQE